jgi:hypothetical protein
VRTKDGNKKTSSGFKELLKERCPWHQKSNHTIEHCYQLWQTLKDTPNPPHAHDMKGKRKVSEGYNFQHPENTVNIIFGGLPTKQV